MSGAGGMSDLLGVGQFYFRLINLNKLKKDERYTC
jgi:hypothetical protein